MAKKYKRHKTNYPGVYFIEGTHVSTGKPERIYYVRYRKNGKMIEEKAGRSEQDDMTAAKANRLRGRRIDGDESTNRETRTEQQGRWTLDQIWKEYKRQRSALKGLAPDESRYKKYLEPAFASKDPSEIVTLDVDRVRLQKMKGKSPQTKKLVLALLKRLINFGVKKGLCPVPDPAKLHIELPSVDNMTTEDLDNDQLKALIKAMNDAENQTVANLMRMALYTGMRRGELFKLKWTDVDFENGFILIDAPKGGRSQTIPLSDAARGVLEKQGRTKSPFVFPGERGQQRKCVARQVNKIKEKGGLPKEFRPLHGLRHVYASMLASSGKVDMYTLQKLLTHKSSAMTQRYAHLRDEALKKGAKVADELLNAVNQSE